jgi:hypothetical protein
LKTNKTIVTAQQLAEMRGYSDIDKLVEDAQKVDACFERAGTPHIWLERWDESMQKVASSGLAASNKSGKTLAETDQLGIINSNLKRLPESIRIKERKLRAKEALYQSAATGNEKYILRGEISKLEAELKRHRENLNKAQERQKQLLAIRSAELDALEAEGNEPDGSVGADKKASTGKSGK